MCDLIEDSYYLIPYTKINSKWLKNLNVRPEIIKLLEDTLGSMLFDIGLSNNFFMYLLRQGQHKQKLTHGATSN